MIPILPPRSKLLLATGDPVNVMSRNAHHCATELAAAAMVEEIPVELDLIKIGALLLPTRLKSDEIVNVLLIPNSKTAGAVMLSDAIVLVWDME